jgi:hypothetical protein
MVLFYVSKIQADHQQTLNILRDYSVCSAISAPFNCPVTIKVSDGKKTNPPAFTPANTANCLRRAAGYQYFLPLHSFRGCVLLREQICV